jgi:FKBP-type peptidyl-prolyl cis-trans isomerase SlyD
MADDTASPGMVVSITYSLKDEQGELFEHQDIPVSYVHGSGAELFPKIEQALDGHGVGDQVEVSLTPEHGFGYPDPSLSFSDPLVNVPEEYRHIGAEVEVTSDRGESRLFYVSKIENGILTMDGNHPLAGQTVTFVVTIVDIHPATTEELQRGIPDRDTRQPLFH